MRLMKAFYVLFLMLISAITVMCQIQDWRKLVPLESTRKEVEKILGKPEKNFKTYGTYQTPAGKFSVWYSKGGCRKNVEELQWKVPAQRLTGILLYTGNILPLESYVENKESYKKENHPMLSNRYFYTSPDESIIYGTIISTQYKEFVYTIELQPSKDKSYLLCKKKK